MKTCKKVFINLILLAGLAPFMYSKSTMLFIDSLGHIAYHYNTLFTLLRAAHFNPVFEQLHQMDFSLIDQSETIMVTLSPELIKAYYDYAKGIKPSNVLLVQGINCLKSLKKQKDKVIVLLFPSVSTSKLQRQSLFIINNLIGNCDSCKDESPLPRTLLHDALQLWASDAQKASYHTSLITLNEKKSESPMLAQTQPTELNAGTSIINHFGLYYSNGINKYFITKTSLMTFAEINENFLYNPIDYSLRKQKLLQLYHFIQAIKASLRNNLEWHICYNNNLPFKVSREYEHEQYKKSIESKMKMTREQYNKFNKQKIWIGWTELRTYKNQEKVAAENILKSGINLIWLELRPEIYFSKHATQADKKEQFMQDFASFTAALKEQSEKLALPAPSIFIGTDVTSNFYKTNLPDNQQAWDAYGTLYPKVPSPLDRTFWTDEVIEPLSFMIDHWKTLGSGLPLGGVFFDFEMYFNQIGEYNNYMDFSDSSWNLYQRYTNNPTLKNIKTIDERVEYLIHAKKFNYYLKFLQMEAYNLGGWIKKSLQQKMPHLMIGVYCVNVPHTWFYLGIVGGLSSSKEPVILATFNNEFYKHYPWLIEHQLYAYHAPVLLLSKLQRIKDFNLIGQLSHNNDGLWFNRISHWEESRNKKDWPWAFEAEVTPLDTQSVTRSLRYAIYKSMSNG